VKLGLAFEEFVAASLATITSLYLRIGVLTCEGSFGRRATKYFVGQWIEALAQLLFIYRYRKLCWALTCHTEEATRQFWSTKLEPQFFGFGHR